MSRERLGAADLPRGGARQRAGRERHDLVDREPARRERALAAARRELRVVLGRRATPTFDEEDHPLRGRPLGAIAHGGDAAAPHARDAADRLLDLVGRVVAPPDDQDVLRPSGQEQLAAVEKAEVAGVEPPLPQHPRRRDRLSQVFAEERGSGDEDPPDPSLGQRRSFRIAHLELEAG